MLREVADRDIQAVFEMESDPVAMRYWSRPPMRALAEARDAVEQAQALFPAGAALRWSICRASDDLMLGHASVFAFSAQNRPRRTGLWPGAAALGPGLHERGADGGDRLRVRTAGMRRLEADTDPRNQASIRALERLGFTREGLLRERWQVGDEISDTAFWGLLAHEWRTLRSAP